jgi:spermidine/putrescine transport system ATP-binding protein
MSDRIAVMSEGRIEQIGTPREIYDSPATVFVAGFIGVANLIPAVVRHVTGAHASVELAGGHRVTVPATGGAHRVGAPATVMVRPERLRLDDAATGEGLPVTLEEAVFHGPVMRYALRAHDGTALVAHVAADRSAPAPAAGAALRVSWEPEAGRLLPAGP